MANFFVNDLLVSPQNLSAAYILSGAITLILAGTIGHTAEHRSPKLLLACSIVMILIPQLAFRLISNSNILLYVALPSYLLISNARAIYQRALILKKDPKDSFHLHLLNNIVIRLGILSSGFALGILAGSTTQVGSLFQSANISSMVSSCLMMLSLVRFPTLKPRRPTQTIT
jgi:predicted MFS family arabinose efflux permease